MPWSQFNFLDFTVNFKLGQIKSRKLFYLVTFLHLVTFILQRHLSSNLCAKLFYLKSATRIILIIYCINFVSIGAIELTAEPSELGNTFLANYAFLNGGKPLKKILIVYDMCKKAWIDTSKTQTVILRDS